MEAVEFSGVGSERALLSACYLGRAWTTAFRLAYISAAAIIIARSVRVLPKSVLTTIEDDSSSLQTKLCAFIPFKLNV